MAGQGEQGSTPLGMGQLVISQPAFPSAWSLRQVSNEAGAGEGAVSSGPPGGRRALMPVGMMMMNKTSTRGDDGSCGPILQMG